jgi:hypothetical protein
VSKLIGSAPTLVAAVIAWRTYKREYPGEKARSESFIKSPLVVSIMAAGVATSGAL